MPILHKLGQVAVDGRRRLPSPEFKCHFSILGLTWIRVQKHDLPIWVAKRLFVHVLIKVDFAANRVPRVCVVLEMELEYWGTEMESDVCQVLAGC
jgi:hypothetical protein